MFTEKKWSIYSSNYLYKESKKKAIDLDLKDYEFTAFALQLALALSSKYEELTFEAKMRHLSIEEFVRDHVQIIIPKDSDNR